MGRTAFNAVAKPVIDVMRSDDECNGRDQKINLMRMEELFGEQENKANRKNSHGQ